MRLNLDSHILLMSSEIENIIILRKFMEEKFHHSNLAKSTFSNLPTYSRFSTKALIR